MLFRTLRTRRRKEVPYLPALEVVEDRLVLSAQPFVATMMPPPSLVQSPGLAAIAPINQKVVNFLASKVGQRLGGGECSHLATEALRVAGAKFVAIGTDSPGAGDYDWGTLVKAVEFKNGAVVDSNPSAAVQPGDVIQYRNATFSNGTSAAHHTSVVAAVDSSGRPTKVYEQNLGNSGAPGANRTVSLQSIDLSKLKGGWVRIYRPEARPDVPGRYEFTIVNNSSSNQSVKLFNSTYSLTPSNTAASYKTFWATGSRPSLTLNGKTYQLDNAAGYEIIGSGSSATLRKLSP